MQSGHSDQSGQPVLGAARLLVVMPVAAVGFFFVALLDYALPLYFRLLSYESPIAFIGGASVYSGDLWSRLVKYQITSMVVSPLIAGMLAQRYGARVVWSFGLLGQAAVPLVLAVKPGPQLIPVIAVWYGITSSIIWTAGISLVQIVASAAKASANGRMLVVLGAGSLCGPLAGRLLLYRREIQLALHSGNWSLAALQFLGGSPLRAPLQVAEFQATFIFLAAISIFAGLAVGFGGQYRGQVFHKQFPRVADHVREILQLLRMPKFRLLAVTICVSAVVPLQAANQFLPYRAESIGLLSAQQDSGWFWLQLLKTFMWILGGFAVGRIAKRRINEFTVVFIIGAAAVGAIGIALSTAAWQLFAGVAIFEFIRQFVRWLNTGFVSDQVPAHLAAASIGLSLTIGGIANAFFGWAAAAVWSGPDASAGPFIAAAAISAIGGVGFILLGGPQLLAKSEPKSDLVAPDSRH